MSSSLTRERTIFWQVGTLAAIALAVIVTNQLGLLWLLGDFESERAAVLDEKAEIARTLERFRDLSGQGALAFREMLRSSRAELSDDDWARRLETEIRIELEDDENSRQVREILGRLHQTALDLQRLWKRTVEWRQRSEKVRQEEEEGTVQDSVHQLLGRLLESVEIVQGADRLRLAGLLMRYQHAEDAATRTDLASQLLQVNMDRFPRRLSIIRNELGELSRQVEVLVHSAELDSLTDLKDNILASSLEQLRRETAALRESRDAQQLTVENIRHLETLLFGREFQIDERHQTIHLGAGGLFNHRQDQLELVDERQRLRAGVFRYEKDLANLNAELAESVQDVFADGVRQIGESLDTARRASLMQSLVLGSLFLMIVASLFSRIQRHLEELAEGRHRIRSLMNGIRDAIVSCGENGVIQSFNPALQRTFGFTGQELPGMKLTDLIVHKTGDRRLSLPGARPESGSSSDAVFEAKAVRRDGTMFPVEVSLSHAQAENDKKSSGSTCIAVIRDISARREAESRLRQAQKLESIGQLAAGIAHEVNTPTQFVNDNTSFLQEAFKDYQRLLDAYEQALQATASGTGIEEGIQAVNSLAEEIDLAYLQEEIPVAIGQSLDGLTRIATIVRAMKEFSHPGTEEKTPIDLNQAIRSTIEVSRNEWKYHAEIHTDFDPKLPLISCLPGEINQVFLNIIVNAAHAIAERLSDDLEKGVIAIATERKANWVEIRISDTGNGIPETIRERIFDPFFTTKEVGKGTGQGLAIAWSVVVDKHCGSISVRSRQGAGATFVIRLPLAPKEAQGDLS